jgi:glycosyltransferase involved in cell wall biosynthesis
MQLSLYTFVQNGLFYDYHTVEMLKHHLPLADEIIVNEGYSSDGTYEAITGIDPKVKVFRSKWGLAKGMDWFTRFKNEARLRCKGDWCILLDCDEFIPEWEFEKIRSYIEHTSDTMARITLLNFYGNYKVFHSNPEKVMWPARKMVLHRNIPEIEIWGDGSNVRLKGTVLDWSSARAEFACHHFGMVRQAARLRQKWRIQSRINTQKPMWLRIPSLLFDYLPHNWKDHQFLDDLTIYDGPYMDTVVRNPSEFVRDDFTVYQYLVEKSRAHPSDACAHGKENQHGAQAKGHL